MDTPEPTGKRANGPCRTMLGVFDILLHVPPSTSRTLARAVTPSPCAQTLLTGHERRDPTWCWRPDGTVTALLIHVRAGAGRVGTGSSGEKTLRTGDTVLWMPAAAQDFGCAPEDRAWEIVWGHFRERDAWRHWMDWPELAPGVRWIPAPDATLCSRIEKNLLDMVTATHTPTKHAVPLAMNSLERALLWLDAAAPSREAFDGRVHDAISFVARHLSEPMHVATIAEAVHLSPSRLSHLFTQQLGVPPARYVEQRRIERAQDLLETTSMTIGSIARAIGFSNQFYFATRFKARTGTDPSRWRAQGVTANSG